MADLENDIMSEDYLDNLLNAVSEPLITEDETAQHNDEGLPELDSELNDLLTSIPDELLNDNENPEDNLDELLKDIENMDISADEEPSEDNSDSDLSEDVAESSEEIQNEESKSGFTESSGSEELDEIHRLSEELLNSHNSDDDADFNDLIRMLEAADSDTSSDDNTEEIQQSDMDEILTEADPDLSELDDIPDKTELDDKKKKKKKKLFGKKKDEETDEELVSEENNDFLKSVEENQEGYMDFSDLEGLEGFEDLAGLTDKGDSEGEKSNEMSPAEKKALKAAKKQEKAEQKAEKNAEKKRIKAEKNAEKKKIKEEKKRQKQREKELHPEEKIKFSLRSVILMVSVIAGVVICSVFGGKALWYNSHIDDANKMLINKNYTDAYNYINGLTIKEKDKSLYNQLKTIMYVERELDSYQNCLKIGMDAEALNSLIKGVDKYNRFKTDAEEYGVLTEMNEVYSKIITKLSEEYGITEEKANELINIKDAKEYSIKLDEIIKQHNTTI